MRIIVADCSAEYSGRLNAYLPMAKRVLLVKADNSFLIFSELGSYKPLNWMAAPCTIREISGQGPGALADTQTQTVDTDDMEPTASTAALHGDVAAGAANAGVASCGLHDDSEIEKAIQVAEAVSEEPIQKVFRVSSTKSDDILEVTIAHVYYDQTFDLGQDPGLVKDGVEDHLQRYLAEQIERIGEGATLVRREYPTPIGPVDIMAKDAQGRHVAIEIKRHGGIDGVEQLTRYCKLLNEDPLIAPVRGIFAAQTITAQAKVLAQSRGFECLILDYDDMKGTKDGNLRLF